MAKKPDWTVTSGPALLVVRESLGLALRRRRQEVGISQTDLAARIGASTKTINGIEFGHSWPSLPLYFALCRALKCGRIPLLS